MSELPFNIPQQSGDYPDQVGGHSFLDPIEGVEDDYNLCSYAYAFPWAPGAEEFFGGGGPLPEAAISGRQPRGKTHWQTHETQLADHHCRRHYVDMLADSRGMLRPIACGENRFPVSPFFAPIMRGAWTVGSGQQSGPDGFRLWAGKLFGLIPVQRPWGYEVVFTTRTSS